MCFPYSLYSFIIFLHKSFLLRKEKKNVSSGGSHFKRVSKNTKVTSIVFYGCVLTGVKYKQQHNCRAVCTNHGYQTRWILQNKYGVNDCLILSGAIVFRFLKLFYFYYFRCHGSEVSVQRQSEKYQYSVFLIVIDREISPSLLGSGPFSWLSWLLKFFKVQNHNDKLWDILVYVYFTSFLNDVTNFCDT